MTAVDRPGPDLRGRAARRPPERGDAAPDGRQAALHRAPRRRRPARDRGDVVRRPVGDPRSWPTPTSCCPSLPRPPGVRYPVLVPNVRGPGAGRGRRRRRDRRLHRRDRRVHDAEHRDDRRRVARGVRAGPRPRAASSAGGGAATSRPRSAARTPGASTRRASSRSRSASRPRRRGGLLRRHDRRRRPGRRSTT